MKRSKIASYLCLMRIDRPIGTLLLLWPTLWSLWLATNGVPNLQLLSLFIAGVFLMRSAGCVINDYADRHIDGLVTRTCQRPLPQGDISPKASLFLFVVLVTAAFLLVCTLNITTILLSGMALLLTGLYPFAKRVTPLPQVVLGLAFSWSILMAFSEVRNQLPLTCWLLLLATICWIIAYDIQYALADRDDDLKIGVKSMAILLGSAGHAVIGLLQGVMLLFMCYIGWLRNLGMAFYVSLLVSAALFFYQHALLANKQPVYYLKAFSNNNYVGAVIFLGLFITLI